MKVSELMDALSEVDPNATVEVSVSDELAGGVSATYDIDDIQSYNGTVTLVTEET